MADPVSIVAPDGTPGTVAPEDLQQALDAGSTLDTPSQAAQRLKVRTFGDTKGIAKAATAGILESVPFVGGAIEKATLGDVSNEKEVNSGSVAGGLAAGTIAQTIATAGVGDAVLGGADAVEAMSTATRALARAGVGAAEGGFYGAGNAVNSAVLDDHPLTAEMLIVNTGGGALLGGALAGGLSLGGDYLGAAAEGIGNKARAMALSHTISTDSQALEDAGFSTSRINQIFREGLVAPGDSAVQVQSRVADRMAQVQQGLSELGGKLDASGQTFDLPQIIQDARTPSLYGMVKPDAGDTTAGWQRLAQFREALQQQTGDDAEKLLTKLDASIVKKAGAIDERLGPQADKLLDQHGLLTDLGRMTDAAVRSGQAPAGALGGLLRQGEHVSMWGSLAHLAGKATGGHLGLATFVGLSAGNALREISENPGAIGEVMGRSLEGVAKTIGKTVEEVKQAVGAALGEVARGAGPIAGQALEHLSLPADATRDDVEVVRDQLQRSNQKLAPNGNPHLMNTVRTHQAILASALPKQTEPPLPENLGRQSAPAPKAVARYNEVLQAVTNPLGVVATIGKGHATTAQLQAVQAAYPKLSAKIAHDLLNRAALAKKPATGAVRRAIGVLAGRPIDPAFSPAKVARIQQLYGAPQPPGRAGAAPGTGQMKPNVTGMQKLDIASRLNPRSQAQEGTK